MSVLTPNMNLVLPTIGVDSGLVWEQSANSNSLTLDQHNHTSGFGTQIPPAGLNINTDLPFNGNSATLLKSTTYTAQSSLATLLSVYVIGNDLYYNDGASNIVRLTAGGAVNATASGIASGSATASFSTGVLVVNSAANTPANIQAGSILIGNNVANSKFLTLSAPGSLAANYTLTLPLIPGSLSFVTLDASGNFGTSSSVSGSQIASGSITGSQLANQTVTATQIANSTITETQIAAGTITAASINASAGIAGTQLITNINLVGSAVQINSHYPLLANVSAGSQYIIVSGIYRTVGGVLGPGFTVTHTATGKYTINFVNAFASGPYVTLTAVSSTGTPVTGTVTGIPSASSAVVEFYNASFSFVDTSFSFVAFGGA